MDFRNLWHRVHRRLNAYLQTGRGNIKFTRHIFRLVREIDQAIQLPTEDFLATVDRAREAFCVAARIDRDLSAKLFATKVINLLVNKHEYFKFSVAKVGRPSGFMLDPANACNLGCPTCQHTSNKQYAAATYVPMPRGILRPDTYSKLIEAIGPYSFAGHFYNNSEPFLNKKIFSYLRTASLHRIETLVSSNLSLPRLNAEDVVQSGLVNLMVAIDGASQDVYVKYRRGGDLALVLDNVARIAAAKRRVNSPTPFLRWQFLTFQHNLHEVEKAVELARKIGFDSFNTATPYDVSGDEASIQVGHYLKAQQGRWEVFFRREPRYQWPHTLDEISNVVDQAFHESLRARYEGMRGIRSSHTPQPRHGHCDWLHLGLIADAVGRIMPCCIPDYAAQGSFVFGDIRKDHDNLFNSEKYLQARLVLANYDRYQAGTDTNQRINRSKCDGCTDRPTPQIGLAAIQSYLWHRAPELAMVLPQGGSVATALTSWSDHTPTATFDI